MTSDDVVESPNGDLFRRMLNACCPGAGCVAIIRGLIHLHAPGRRPTREVERVSVSYGVPAPSDPAYSVTVVPHSATVTAAALWCATCEAPYPCRTARWIADELRVGYVHPATRIGG